MTFPHFAQWNIRAAAMLALGMLFMLYAHLLTVGMTNHTGMMSEEHIATAMPCVTFCMIVTESTLRKNIIIIVDNIYKQFTVVVFAVASVGALLRCTIFSHTKIPQRLQCYYQTSRHVWQSFTLYPLLFQQGILAPRLYA